MATLKDSWRTLGEGLWRQTPPFFTALGLCPALAVTTAAVNGVVMGLATTAVLVGTALLTLAIRDIIPRQVRIPVYTVIIATLVTVVDLILSGLLPSIHAVLGLFIPLIIVNCLILGRVEVAFTKMSPMLALSDAFGYGLGFTWALAVIGAVRELFSAGTIFGYNVMAAGFEPWQIMSTPPGAFLTMGVFVAVIQTVRAYYEKRSKAVDAKRRATSPSVAQ